MSDSKEYPKILFLATLGMPREILPSRSTGAQCFHLCNRQAMENKWQL